MKHKTLTMAVGAVAMAMMSGCGASDSATPTDESTGTASSAYGLYEINYACTDVRVFDCAGTSNACLEGWMHRGWRMYVTEYYSGMVYGYSYGLQVWGWSNQQYLKTNLANC